MYRYIRFGSPVFVPIIRELKMDGYIEGVSEQKSGKRRGLSKIWRKRETSAIAVVFDSMQTARDT